MPIYSPLNFRSCAQSEFARIDYEVMRHVFECHNELGRLCNEHIYLRDLRVRLKGAGHAIDSEIRLSVSHKDFCKNYFVDLVVDEVGLYELKTVSRFVDQHDAQVMNYLHLHGIQHGKLLNFRPSRVESRFVNTTLSSTARRAFTIDRLRWKNLDENSRGLVQIFSDLLVDWGTCLELPLYTEALIHFLGGPAAVVQKIPIRRNGEFLGTHPMNTLNARTAFQITALTGDLEPYEKHTGALMKHTPFDAIQWINMERSKIKLITIQR